LIEPLKILDTFAGIGGFSYAAEKLVRGFETTQFIEIEPYCQKVLKKHWPNVPIHDDIKTFTARPFQFDVITGGFPCQDISVAGLQKGITKQSRSGLFYELIRVIRLVRPKYVILENVAAILNNGLDIVLGELAEAGFDCEWACISASSLGACHRRSRWWCVAINREFAYPNNDGQQGREFETRNKITPGKDTSGKWSTNTSDFERQSDDGNDQRESKTDENLSGSSDGGKTIFTTTREICDLSKGTNNDQRTSSQDNYQKNNDRTLVSEGQSGVQLSQYRKLGGNKTTSEDNSIRYGDENSSEQRMDNQESNVTNSNFNGSSSSKKSRSIKKTNGGAEKREDFLIESKGSGKSQNSRDFQQFATNPKGSKRDGNETKQRNGKPRTQEISRDRNSSKSTHIWRSTEYRLNPNWREYVSQPTICRGDDGLSNRVDRLRSLGNSIVPSVAAIPLQRVHDLYYK
jgi:DNA (cytosine-5)-methyltransferase 1